MILKQYYLGCLAHASYLIVDEKAKSAAVVDPQRDVDEYVEDARRLGASIDHVLLTHFHADFLAGHLELRERTGARIHLGEKAEAQYDFHPLADRATLELGDGVRLQALATPGHTPESTSLLVYDLGESADAPHAVLTGDTLFIGDVGRPDLMASVGITAAELAGMMYDSLHQKLLTLPDETLVYPAHGAGSMCGKNLSTDTVSTIGAQRATNYALQPMEKDEFVRMVTSNQPEAPAYFPYDAQLNKEERATLDEALAASGRPLELDELVRLHNAGSQVLDARTAEEFAVWHLAGSINIGLGGKYATWAGTLLDKDRPIVLIADPGTEREATMRLGRIGFDRVDGHLEGGFDAARERTELLQAGGRVNPDELGALLETDDPPLVLDVRTPGEWENGHIEGALHVPLNRLRKSVDSVPRDRRLVVTCKAGYRSSSALSILQSEGYENVIDLRGGMDAWDGIEPEPADCSS